jgi:hypothetical protein
MVVIYEKPATNSLNEAESVQDAWNRLDEKGEVLKKRVLDR